jgi:hypothetical protein
MQRESVPLSFLPIMCDQIPDQVVGKITGRSGVSTGQFRLAFSNGDVT